MTVDGENFNSVAEPRIEVTTVISTVVANDTNLMVGSGSDTDLNTTWTYVDISDASIARPVLFQ